VPHLLGTKVRGTCQADAIPASRERHGTPVACSAEVVGRSEDTTCTHTFGDELLLIVKSKNE
jgi:hypothetical protein